MNFMTISTVVCLVVGSINATERRKAHSSCRRDFSKSFHDLAAKDLDGKNVSMSEHSGHVILAVNVATFCDFTLQYYDLNALQKDLFKPQGSTEDSCGLRIIGFPCNQFGLQEPAANKYELLNGLKYVRPGHGFEPIFALYEKRDVNGENEDEIYSFLKVRFTTEVYNSFKY